MSRRRNGTNRAGSALGVSRYTGKQNKKRAAGAAPPSGTEKINFQDQCSTIEADEQAKIEKAMVLVRMALEINGTKERLQEETGLLPTMFVYYSGHVSSLNIQCHEDGWCSGSSCEEKTLRLNRAKFDQEYADLKNWLEEINRKMYLKQKEV